MWRTILSVVAGLAAWVMVITLLNFGLRAAIPGYHAAEATLQFTMAMKVGRLTEAALASIAAGGVVRLIEPTRRWVPAIVGLLILGMFLPVHVNLWGKFPAWYHLSFLLPIVPLVVLGRELVGSGRSRKLATAS